MKRAPVMDAAPGRVLILALGGAGDCLMLLPLLRALRAAYPSARLEALVMQGRSAAALLSAGGCLDEVVLHDFREDSRWGGLCYAFGLRRRRYDLLISPMPHHRLEHNLIAWLTGARLRVGFRYVIESGAHPRWFLHRTLEENPALHLVENNLRVLPELLGRPRAVAERRLGLAVPEEARARAVGVLEALGAGVGGGPLIGLHPGSGTTKNLELKRWPTAHWVALVALLRRETAARLVLLAGPGEEALCEAIVAGAGNADGRLLRLPLMPVLELAGLLERLDLVVCCDNLITQLAAAVDTPTVAIYGPTSHIFAAPYGVRHRIVRTGLACSPCYGYSRHGIRCTNSVPLRCLRQLEAPLVMRAIAELLA